LPAVNPDRESTGQYLQLIYAAGDGGELLFIEVSDHGAGASLDRFARAPLRESSDPAPAARR
jgi:hypothetical protein